MCELVMPRHMLLSVEDAPLNANPAYPMRMVVGPGKQGLPTRLLPGEAVPGLCLGRRA